MAHTPGTWKADRHLISDGWRVFVQHNADNDQHDAICDLETWQSDEQTEANARLIADAPRLAEENATLLDALKMAVRFLEHPDVLAITNQMAVRGQVLVDRIHSAITQAEGGE